MKSNVIDVIDSFDYLI